MDENLFAHQNQQFALDLNEEQSSFGDFMNEEQLSNVDDPASNHVDWDNIEVEELMKPYEKFVAPSIVAEPPLDIDWSSHFTKQLVFDTRDALKQWIAEFGQKHNMSLVVKKSDYRDKRNPRIIFSCHRSGVYRPRAKKGSGENLKKRDTGTTKCECPFEVKFVKMFGVDDGWKIDSVKCRRHNHQLSSYLHGHHVHARLKPGEEEMLADFISAGIKPKQALTIIKRKDPSNTSSLQTVYNAKKKLIKASREGRTEFQQIGKEGADEGWIIRDRRDYLTDFPIDYLFAHPDSISLAKCFPHVFVMDCTYKTNQYGWPLFEIIGVASTGQTFPVCYCFMQNETTDHYLWALGCFKELLGDGEVPSAIVTDKDQACMSAVQAVFPDSYHLLCRWHILKGVEKKGKQCLPNEEDEKKDKKEGKEEEIHIPFGIERKKGWQAKLKEKWLECWNEIVWSKTLEAYEENLATLQQEFIQWPQLYEYVLTWLEFKEKFVTVWTDRVFHIGNTSSNRVEGAHNTLKSSLLRSRRHTFLTMFHLIKNSMTILVSEIKKQLTMSLNLQSHAISIPFFKNIKGSVSSECTKILVAEYEKSTKGITLEIGCNCALQVTSGLPCAYKITALERGGKRLELYDVHDFWKKLCIIPRRVDFDELEMQEDFQLWVATYRKSSSEYKKYMLRRLREDALKETTWLNTPVEIPNVKGRPPSSKEPKQKKVDHSTRREPSAFEREDPEIPIAPPGIYYSLGSQHFNTNSGRLSVKNPSSKQKIKRAKTSTSVMEFYKGNLPTGYEHHVKDITQVKGDGNCGFRAVAVGLGMDEDIGWVKVREDCVKELDKNFDLYSTICGGPDHAAVLRNRINHYQSLCMENDRYWMIMPETGFLLVNAYRKIVVYMAKREYVTFFQSFVPMMEPPPLEPRNPDFHMICILWTSGHYVPVQLHPNSPIPSATYFCLKYGSVGMLGWNEMIHERNTMFELLYPDRFGTRGKDVEEFILSDEDYNDKIA